MRPKWDSSGSNCCAAAVRGPAKLGEPATRPPTPTPSAPRNHLRLCRGRMMPSEGDSYLCRPFMMAFSAEGARLVRRAQDFFVTVHFPWISRGVVARTRERDRGERPYLQARLAPASREWGTGGGAR